METNDREELKRLTEKLTISPNDVETLYERGIVYTRIGDYHKALTDMDKIIKIEPSHEFANNIRPKIIYQMALEVKIASGIPFDFFEAIQKGLKVPAPDPRSGIFGNDFAAVTYLGDAIQYSEKGDCIKAIEKFTEVIKNKPDHIFAFFGRAEMYHLLGKYDLAINDYDMVEQINLANIDTEKIKNEARINRQRAIESKNGN